MRKTILALILATAAPVWSGIAIIGSPSYEAGSGTSVTSTAVSTTGSSLIIIGCEGSSSAATSVTNSGTADSWHLLSSKSASGGGFILIAYAYAPTTSSSQTFTCHFSTSQSDSWVAPLVVSGTLTTSSVLDTNTGATNTGGVTVQPGSITPAGTGELLVTMAVNSADSSNTCSNITINDSFGNEEVSCSVYPDNSDFAYLIDSSSSSINPTWDFISSGGTTNAAVIAAFKPSGTVTKSGFPGFIRSSLEIPHYWLRSDVEKRIWQWHDRQTKKM